MANTKKQDRIQDADVKALNHLGLGLKTISEILGCHAATITMRLKAMGVELNDTRHSFMGQVFKSLTLTEQEWLSHNLYNAGIGIKEFVVTLIREAYAASSAVTTAAPPEMPVMLSTPVTPEYVEDVPEEAAPTPGEPKSLFGS